MALVTKVQVVSVSKDGKTVMIKDATGSYDAGTNTTGYGGTNPAAASFNKVFFTFNNWGLDDDMKDYAQSGVRDVPAVNTITAGTNVPITSYSLGATQVDLALQGFTDGVLDIMMYTVLTNALTIVGTNGSHSISGTANLGSLLTLPAVVINNLVYTIDNSQTNTSSLIHLVEPLVGNQTLASGAYRANTKALVLAAGERCLVSKIGKFAEENCCEDQATLDKLTQYMMFKFAAQIDFDCKNYSKAHNLAQATANYCTEDDCAKKGGC